VFFVNNSNQSENKIHAQNITLPQGGGSIKGIGDTFQPNAFSGTGDYSIPIPVSSARGFEPSLSLNYSSGSGNDIFGIGFSLTMPRIYRRTDLGIPQYAGEDTYILESEGVLTPKMIEKNGKWLPDETTIEQDGITWKVTTFLPRKQSGFSLITHWQNPLTMGSRWEVISRNNITTLYGSSENSRVADPADPRKIFEWLIDESHDGKGNRICYQYKPEDGKNISKKIFEFNRSLFAKKYPEKILYGNHFDDANPDKELFAYELVFDYGEYDIANLELPNSNPAMPVGDWKERSDPFSTYRSGFEIRTLRLCRNILIFHKFKELGSNPCLVKALQLTHDETPVMSFVTAVTETGFRPNLDGSYAAQSLPPLEFEYSRFIPPLAPKFSTLTVDDENGIPGYLDKTSFNPVDLKGEGLPGMLLANGSSTLYFEPLGNGAYQQPCAPAAFPNFQNFQNPELSLQSIDGNGQLALVVNGPGVAGFFDQQYNGNWSDFRPFAAVPTDLTNPLTANVDLVGNGKADLLLFQQPDLLFYLSAGKAGYGTARRTTLPPAFPAASNYGERELVTFANIFGDGLSHRVKISSGSVEAWPNYGYGNFGKKVTFGNAPQFDTAIRISRIFLADVDGSGTIDLVVAYFDRVDIYLNLSGNAFAEHAISVRLPDTFTDLDQIQFADILGEGTSALVFTKAGAPMRHWYYNFCGNSQAQKNGKMVEETVLKPYLLTKVSNNLGASTEIYYASSTQFYLADKQKGQPWVTRLPFPVQVVKKVVSVDEISGSRLTTQYAYHDGYYDYAERQFRGFGFVESWDSETPEQFQSSGGKSPAWVNQELYIPPVYTKTWHHTGAFLENGIITRQYSQQYFQGDKDAYNFPDSVLDSAVLQSNSETLRQAYVALAGTVMRQETYAQDGSVAAANPYSVSESNVEVILVQPVVAQQDYAVFQVNPRESIAYQYERNAADPRVQQSFTLEVDPLCGEVVKTCTISLRRRDGSHTHYVEQDTLKATAEFNQYINTDDTVTYRYRGIAWQHQQFEVLGLDLKGKPYFSFEDQEIQALGATMAQPLPYQAPPTAGLVQAQQLLWTQNYFWDEEQAAVLPAGQICAQALLHHSRSAVFTQAFVTDVFAPQLVDETIQTKGGYVFEEANGYWWNCGLTQFYSPASAFYTPSGVENSFVDPNSSLFVKTTVKYDTYFFFVVETSEYIDEKADIKNVMSAEVDYVTQQPYQLTDINGTITQALFDPLGQVIVTTLFGVENGAPVGGMRLYPHDGKPTEYIHHDDATFDATINNPEKYLQGATSYFYYNLHAWRDQKQPPCAINLIRDDYYHLVQGTSTFACKTSIGYSDGFGRELASKLKTDKGWAVTGRTVYNNKGKPCEQYLPYFSANSIYETQQEIIDQADAQPPTITHYDPLLRVIRVDTAKGFFSKIEFTPWEETTWDENDTVLDSPYYIRFMKNYPATPTQQQQDEKDALDKAVVFANTPSGKVLDNVGNAFLETQSLNSKVSPVPRQLIAYSRTDIQGRLQLTIDPRLYQSNQTSGTSYYNFKYRYAMGEKDPVLTNSVDAGILKNLNNIFGEQIWTLSARQYCQLISYDRLQRRATLQVKKLLDDSPIHSYADFNLVETFEYGEATTATPNANLRGQLYQMHDLSGLVKNSQYGLQGDLLETSRQMAVEYKTAIDWNSSPPPKLETRVYTSHFTSNALKLLLTETSPDGSVTTKVYNQAGQLNQINGLFADGSSQQVIAAIEYDAKGQKILTQYGNGITTSYAYEESTLRLISLHSTRLDTPTDTVQNISYTYDPVGNVTRSWNSTFKTIFNNNQQVDPLADYSYDALYRLITANGRQHPSINVNTYKNNIKDGDFKQCLFNQLPSANDGDKLENYSEIYSYDDSGNLINKQHNAVSSTWNKKTAVESNSNRLAGAEYDASGNLRQLDINTPASPDAKLLFNCCENLVGAKIIIRPDELDDCDYYVYDSSEQRTRKVSERMANGGAVTLIEEKVYLGSYEIKRNVRVNAQGDKTTTMERQTLRIMDDSTCVLITHYCAIGDEAGTRKLRFQMGNNLGSITSEYDKSAQLISYEEYFPYGGTAIIAGSNQAEVKLKEYRYSGKECDDSTGLYYYGARYYAPWLGRWLNPDPAGTIDGLNLFAFVGGSPITDSDSNGLVAIKGKGKGKGAGTKNTHVVLNRRFKMLGGGVRKNFMKNGTFTVVIPNPSGHKPNFLAKIIMDKSKLTPKKWGGFYRALHDEQDELVSTSSVREFVAGVLEGKPLTVTEQTTFNSVLNVVSSVRFPTKWSGYANSLALTGSSRMQHPTSPGSGIWRASIKSGEGNPHSELDRQRKEEVLAAMQQETVKNGSTLDSVLKAALVRGIAFTLNEFTAPATAKDQYAVSSIAQKEKDDQVDAREQLKAVAVSLGGIQDVAADTSRGRDWGNRQGLRSLSPSRV
jgi:RHS repeat-associated protein